MARESLENCKNTESLLPFPRRNSLTSCVAEVEVVCDCQHEWQCKRTYSNELGVLELAGAIVVDFVDELLHLQWKMSGKTAPKKKKSCSGITSS